MRLPRAFSVPIPMMSSQENKTEYRIVRIYLTKIFFFFLSHLWNIMSKIEVGKLFCKEPDNKYFQLCMPFGLR